MLLFKRNRFAKRQIGMWIFKIDAKKVKSVRVKCTSSTSVGKVDLGWARSERGP